MKFFQWICEVRKIWQSIFRGGLTIALISHGGKVMLKILQARIQQYVNRELPDVQAGFIYFFIFLKFYF